MSGSFLLDTNVIVALFAKETSVTDHVSDPATSVFIPSIAVGELYYGAAKSGRPAANAAQADAFVAANIILSCDSTTGKFYGTTKSMLRAKGRPIPENDIWIAAIALQYDLTLVSRDGHFLEVEGLRLERW
jgi:tRNA(fMet)-specific endonuclease VapC